MITRLNREQVAYALEQLTERSLDSVAQEFKINQVRLQTILETAKREGFAAFEQSELNR